MIQRLDTPNKFYLLIFWWKSACHGCYHQYIIIPLHVYIQTHRTDVILKAGDLFIVRWPWQYPPCCDPAAARPGNITVSRLTPSHQQQPEEHTKTSAAWVRGKHTHRAPQHTYEDEVVFDGLMKQERDLIYTCEQHIQTNVHTHLHTIYKDCPHVAAKILNTFFKKNQ